jgi:hypothetical protein
MSKNPFNFGFPKKLKTVDDGLLYICFTFEKLNM